MRSSSCGTTEYRTLLAYSACICDTPMCAIGTAVIHFLSCGYIVGQSSRTIRILGRLRVHISETFSLKIEIGVGCQIFCHRSCSCRATRRHGCVQLFLCALWRKRRLEMCFLLSGRAVSDSSSRSQVATSWSCPVLLLVESMSLQVARDSIRRCVIVQGGVPFGQRESSGVCDMRCSTPGIRCSTLARLVVVPSRRLRLSPG